MSLLSRRRFLAAVGAAGFGAACGRDGGEALTPVGDAIAAPGRTRIAYGGDGDTDAFADLWLPASDGLVPVVVLVHGGFWRDGFHLDLMDGLAESVMEAGYAAWNIEYRRVGGGGGYPETFRDVAAAVDRLATVVDFVPHLDLGRVAVVGHSAGGHLAAWAASRHRIPSGSPGADPAVRPVLAVPQAGVLDLASCAADGVGGSACPDLLGGLPADVPDRYEVTSPVALLPTGVPVVAVHGTGDAIVPLSQSERYVDAAVSADDPAELVTVDGADHFDLIDPEHRAWTAVLDVLARHLR